MIVEIFNPVIAIVICFSMTLYTEGYAILLGCIVFGIVYVMDYLSWFSTYKASMVVSLPYRLFESLVESWRIRFKRTSSIPRSAVLSSIVACLRTEFPTANGEKTSFYKEYFSTFLASSFNFSTLPVICFFSGSARSITGLRTKLYFIFSVLFNGEFLTTILAYLFSFSTLPMRRVFTKSMLSVAGSRTIFSRFTPVRNGESNTAVETNFRYQGHFVT